MEQQSHPLILAVYMNFSPLFWDCSGWIVLLMGGLRKSMQLYMQQIYNKFSLFYWHFNAPEKTGGIC